MKLLYINMGKLKLEQNIYYGLFWISKQNSPLAIETVKDQIRFAQVIRVHSHELIPPTYF